MFADGVRASGLELMAANDVAEGVDLTIAFMTEDRWGRGAREKAALGILKAYGPAAGKALPYLVKMKEGKQTPEQLAEIDTVIAAIETGEQRELRSIASYINTP